MIPSVRTAAIETAKYYEGLCKAHDRLQKQRIWADFEIFEFEDQVYGSALVPASFDRVLRQLEAVSPWGNEVLVYQYLGMMNKLGSAAFAGCPQSAKLYMDYKIWLKRRG